VRPDSFEQEVEQVQTKVTSMGAEVIIGDQLPTVLIGERINPTGKNRLSGALEAGELEPVRLEALAQVEAGADILDINVGVPGVDELTLISDAVQMLIETVDAPLCIDSNDSKALEAALKVYRGKPLINSVNGEERSLKEVLPLVREYGASVIGLTMEEKNMPNDADGRLKIAVKIIEQAESEGIHREDVIIDCLLMSVGAYGKAGLVALEAIRRIKTELGVNMTLGASNISFGVPDRDLLNSAFLAMAIAAGINCPIVDAAKVRPTVLAVDLALGRDIYAKRYTKAFRARLKG
jgi:5-methyltetrahydrofolate--homocysteine methyltransferase